MNSCIYLIAGVCTLTFINGVISCNGYSFAGNSLSEWTSAAWKNTKLGGDTPYSKSFVENPTIICPTKREGFATFYDWQLACNTLPRFHMGKRNPYSTVLDKDLFETEIYRTFDTIYKKYKEVHWINNNKIGFRRGGFEAYAEKLIIPTDATVIIHGDLHGDIHSLNRFIEFCASKGYMDRNDPFKISDANVYILFLGDYVDRGWYGAEVFYAIMRLKNENPDRVFMVRGNHEDLHINNKYGFSQEISTKFGDKCFALILLDQIYNQLPIVLYLGSGKSHVNVVQCCHGGIELGFNPKSLLTDSHKHARVVINLLMQQAEFDKIACPELNPFKKYFRNQQVSEINGFMWNDFIANPITPFELSTRDGRQGSMLDYGQVVTRHLLSSWSSKTYTIRSVFRAHQHGDPDMKARILNVDGLSHADDVGMGKLWIDSSAENMMIHRLEPGRLDDIFAITFSIAPDTGYGYPIHAFGILKVAEKYEDWRLETIRVLYKP